MDFSRYKDLKTSRGINYHYYALPAHAEKPTLLFLHGFPSTSHDWRKQVPHFQARGYGIIVPDLLGYGGTDKPIDTEAYRASLMTKDIIDILDSEGLERVVVIGHDWGTFLTSRLMNFFPGRFTAAAFLAGWYFSVEHLDPIKVNEKTKEELGYELFGYWYFFSEDGADKIIENHFDAFFGVLFPNDPASWKTDFAPLGALKKVLLEDKQSPLPSYLTEDDKKTMRDALLKGGFKAPVNWYKQHVIGIGNDDNKLIPEDRYTLDHPVFFGGAAKDYICIPAIGKPATERWCKNMTVKEYDSDHWVTFSHAGPLNADLEAWIEGVVEK